MSFLFLHLTHLLFIQVMIHVFDAAKTGLL